MNRSFRHALLFALVSTFLVLTAIPAFAATGTFSNSTPISIPNGAPGTTSGPADVYPSNIVASGFTGNITDVNVSLLDFSHTFPDDVNVLLVGPGGQNVLLMSDAGSGTDVNNLNLTFDQAAGAAIPDGGPLVSGTYLPSIYTPQDFPAPAPVQPYGTSLDLFNGTAPNGTWSLYVFDDAGADVGSIAGGWSLEITDDGIVAPPAALPPPPPVPTCNQVGNETSSVVRAQAADGTVTDGAVFCRVLAENGSFRGDSGQVGNLSLIQQGVWQAVDVFGLTAAGNPVVPFNHPVYVCLKGTGTLYYADASNAPRTFVEMAGIEQDGFTCASLPNAGTLVLVGTGNAAAGGDK